MSGERRPGVGPNLVVGIGIMLLGVALLLERLGVVDASTLLRYWPVLLVLLGAGMVAQALWGNPEDARERGTGMGGLWVVIVVFALFSWNAHRQRDVPAETDAERVSLVAVMGSDRRTSLAVPFRGADMTTLMGETRLDLRQATLAPGADAVIDVFTLMGGAVVHIPRDWAVQVEAVPVMGRVRDARLVPMEEPEDQAEEAEDQAADEDDTPRARRRGRGEFDGANVPTARGTLAPLDPREGGGPPPRLVLRGFVMMGGITIRS